MDDLIWRSLQGITTPEEARTLARWRAESPANERQYRELAALWGAVAVAERPRPNTARPSTAEILNQADAHERQRRRRALSGLGWHRAWVRATAAAAAVVVLSVALHLVRGPISDLGQEVVTGPTETVSVRLADGSVLRLGPDSRLRFPDGMRTRDVWLEGKAFFEIAHQDGRRFTVKSHAGTTTVLGTRFEMQTDEDGLRVVVVDGRVAVQAGGNRAEVGAGEVSYIVRGSAPAVARVENPRALLDWMEHVLLFQDTPLRRAVAEIEAEYGVPIVVEDSILGERLVTAFFMDQPVEAVVTVVCQVVDAICSIGGDRIYVRLDTP